MAIDYTKAFEFSDGLQFEEGSWIGSGPDDPTFAAPIGSRYYKSTAGTFWYKHGALDSEWCEVATRVLTLAKNGASNDSWLRFHDNVNSNEVPWIPECEYEVMAIKYSNKNRGSNGSPHEVQISAYQETAGTAGNIGTGDSIAWYLDSNGTTVYYNDRGRTFMVLGDPGDTMTPDYQYAFRLTRLAGSNSINDPHIEIFLRII